MLFPSLKYGEKEIPEKFLWGGGGGGGGRNLWGGVHGETNDQIIGGAKCIFP